MDKQKQIEEIVKFHCDELCSNGICKEDNKPCVINNGNYCAVIENAKRLLDRLIPENAVVLTREEFENLGLVVETVQEYESQNGQPVLVKERKVVKKSQTDFVELLNRETRELQISLQARKETAEKFAEKLFEVFDEYFLYDRAFINRKINEICKEITDKGVQNGN